MSRQEPGRNLSSKSPPVRQPGGNTTERSSSREGRDAAAAAAATAAAAGVEETRSPGAQLPSLASLSSPTAHRQGQLPSLLNTAGSPYGQEGRRKTPPSASEDPGASSRLRQEPLGTSHTSSSDQSQYQRPAGIEPERNSGAGPGSRYSVPPTAEAYRSPTSSYVVRTPPRQAEHGMGPPQPPPATAAAAAAAEASATTATRPELSPYGTQTQQYAPLLPPASGGQSQRQYPGFDPRFRFPSSQSHPSPGLTSPTEARYAAISSGEGARHLAAQEREVGHRFGDSSSQGSILMSETGPLSFPIDHQAASRVADEKRRRNAGASARFRARRKEKEQQNTREIDDLKLKIRELEEDAEFYRRERDYFVSVLINSAERDRYFPRPPSPRRIRVSRPPAEEDYVSYEEHGQRGGDDRTGRRRLTGEYNQSQGQDPPRGPLPPPPPQPGGAPAPHAPGQPPQRYQQAAQHRHYASAPPYAPPPPPPLHQGPQNYSQAPSYAPPPQYYYGSEAQRAPSAASEPRPPPPPPSLPPASSQAYGASQPPVATSSQRTSTPNQAQQHSQTLSQQQQPSHSASASWGAPPSQRPP